MTIPGKRFRADWATIGRSVADLRRSSSSRETSSIVDEALAASGPLHPEPALGLPAAERLDRHAEHLGGLADADPERRLIMDFVHTAEYPP